MNCNNPEQIRTLLEKYYEGSTTAPEEEILCEYFAGDFDPSLSDDAEVFRSLGALQEFEIPEPEGLEERITAALRPQAPASRTRRFYRILSFGTAAAAVLVIGILLIKSLTGQYISPLSIPHTGGSISEILAQSSTEVASPPEQEPPTGQIQKPLQQPKSKQTQATAKTATEAPSSSYDDFREVTDPEEAAKIMQEVNALLARNFAQSDRAMLMADAAIDKSITKYVTITQKLSE